MLKLSSADVEEEIKIKLLHYCVQNPEFLYEASNHGICTTVLNSVQIMAFRLFVLYTLF